MPNNFATTTPPIGLKFIIKNINTRKAVGLFGIKINPNESADLMDIPEMDEDTIKTSLIKGSLKQKLEDGEILILDSTLSLPILDATYRDFLISKGLQSASVFTNSSITVDTLTDLQNLTTSSLEEGTLVYLVSRKAYFAWDPASILTANNITVVGTGTGRWFRQFLANEKWLQQTTWYIDNAAGNDENNGLTSGTAIKTVEELFNRLAGRLNVSITVNLLSNITESRPSLRLAALTTNLSVTIIGTRTISRTSTFTAAGTNPTPASNLSGTATDTNLVDWSADIGKQIRSGSVFAWVSKDLGSGVARINEWISSSYGTGTPPSNGATYTIENVLDATGLDITVDNNDGNKIPLIFQDCKINTTPETSARYDGCDYARNEFKTNVTVTFRGCIFQTNANLNITRNSYIIFNRCTFRATGSNVSLVFRDGMTESEVTNCLFQKHKLSVDNCFLTLTSSGFYETNSNAAAATNNGYLDIVDQSFYGADNTGVLLAVQGGAKIRIQGSYVPTATSSVTDVALIDGLTTAFPPFEASAGGSLPALAAMSTFAQLTSSPFSGVAWRTNTLSRFTRT